MHELLADAVVGVQESNLQPSCSLNICLSFQVSSSVCTSCRNFLLYVNKLINNLINTLSRCLLWSSSAGRRVLQPCLVAPTCPDAFRCSFRRMTVCSSLLQTQQDSASYAEHENICNNTGVIRGGVIFSERRLDVQLNKLSAVLFLYKQSDRQDPHQLNPRS